MPQNILIKILFHSHRWDGALDYFPVRLELFYLIGAEKYRRVIFGDLCPIFFCILDESATDEDKEWSATDEEEEECHVDLRWLAVTYRYCWLRFGLTISWRFYVDLSLMQSLPDRCWELFESSYYWDGVNISENVEYFFQIYLDILALKVWERFELKSFFDYSQRGIVQFPAVYSSAPLPLHDWLRT